jgi:hypothetical protein
MAETHTHPHAHTHTPELSKEEKAKKKEEEAKEKAPPHDRTERLETARIFVPHMTNPSRTRKEVCREALDMADILLAELDKPSTVGQLEVKADKQ